ncbi:MAG: hypothetical protein NC181_05005 [Clostridium sp.]|nr:hypothetical protein [Clostridium sp.]MCM1444658.1 hypothetical protein [Candidatus Amulumruptor caecigallinarius]
MLDKIVSNPTLFYTIFTLLCIFLILFIVFIASFIKKRVERNKLKKTSNAILTEHYEDENNQNLEDEIKKIEEKVKQNEEVVHEKENVSKNSFIIGEPIQIEINGELGGDLEEVKDVDVNQPDYIDSILSKMQEDLTKKDERQIHEFEKEQEESAIISYQELLKANNKDSVLKQDVQPSLEDILNTNSTISNASLINVESMEDLSVISLDDNTYNATIDVDKEIKNLKKVITSQVNKVSTESSNIEIDYNDKHFKTSDFISPVYGRIETKLDYPTIPSIEKLKDKPISEMKDDEFLSVLKAFRRNL